MSWLFQLIYIPIESRVPRVILLVVNMNRLTEWSKELVLKN